MTEPTTEQVPDYVRALVRAVTTGEPLDFEGAEVPVQVLRELEAAFNPCSICGLTDPPGYRFHACPPAPRDWVTTELVSINKPRDEHRRYCQGSIEPWGQYGDVRRCEHGKVMLGVGRLGTVPAVWCTLHPILDPIQHWRARRALARSAS